jgi:hypothetical protein
MRNAVTAIGLVLIVGCSVQSSPVPVRGNAAVLVGEWSGDYRSGVTGRTGSIVFTLQAGRDTAFGDILMIPYNFEQRMDSRVPDLNRPSPQLLRISFVGCEGREVSGWLEPYRDPDTGEQLYTSFQGILKGDELKGTFVTGGEQSGPRLQGSWRVKRKAVSH